MKISKLSKNLKKNKPVFLLVVVIFLFPLVVGLIYRIPLPRIINLDSGDLLAFYGTAFGIFASFITYRIEVEKKEKERTKELRPNFAVNLEKDNKDNKLFTINVVKATDNKVTYLYLYDEFVSYTVEKFHSFNVTYCLTKEEQIDGTYNITIDSEIIDSDGYPKYIQIGCNDTDGNNWDCCFRKIRDNQNVYYYPEYFEII